MSTAGLHANGHPLQAAVQSAMRPVLAGRTHPVCVLVGFSGGRDSSVLLHAAVAALGAPHVIAVHINHQLQKSADHWQTHTEQVAVALGCQYRCVRATPPVTHPAGGIEAWARSFRRAAFAEIARELDAAAVLLAHHADDQVETILLNWGRGAGPSGLTGMQQQTELDGIALLRPLLHFPVTALDEYAQLFDLTWVEDPSNTDTALRRNRVRHEVLPLLDDVFPGFRGNVLRHAQLVRAQAVMGDVGGVEPTPSGDTFDRRGFASQSDHVLDAMLHRWLRSLGQRAPTQARTRHLREQLLRSESAYAQCRHDGAWLRRYRDQIEWIEQLPTPVAGESALVWQGERQLALPAFGGVLLLREAAQGEPGLPRACLIDPALTVSALRMNASMRVAITGRNRRLRLLCQEQGIPSWQRQRLPMLSRGADVVFAAELGLNHEFALKTGPERWQIEFQPMLPPGRPLAPSILSG